MRRPLLLMAIFLNVTPKVGAAPLGLDSLTVLHLAYTAKVWGFMKYFHPSIAKGTMNWDQALLDVIPDVVLSRDNQDFNRALRKMITSVGEPPESYAALPFVPDSLRYNLDLRWLGDSVFSPEVRSALDTVRSRFRPQANYYATGYPAFDNDNRFYVKEDFDTPIDKMRLLSLFRYWNIINYFFPYKNLLDKNWDDVLLEFIPKLWDANELLSYHYTFMELAVKINDGHANTRSAVIDSLISGMYYLPLVLQTVENQTVITKVLGDTSSIKPGDIVRKIDGVDVRDLRERWKRYVPRSNDAGLEWVLNRHLLLGSQNQSARVLLEGPTGQKEVVLSRIDFTTYFYLSLASGPIWKKLYPYHAAHAYGYIDMARLDTADIGHMFSDLWDTDALIFDCRNYPLGTMWEIVRYLYPSPLCIAGFTIPDYRYPGTFSWWPTYVGGNNLSKPYDKLIMILFDEKTGSQAEYSVMGLEQHKPSLKIGSQSMGEDGNVVSVYLPGGIRTWFSGAGVFYPDGTPTQRVGIIPDIEVRPTIEGIRQGRDEVLETALNQAFQQSDWSWQPPFPQWNDLHCVYALDANTIFAVGDLGTIVKTTDGGRTWNRQVSGTTAHLHSVWFANPSSGIAVGDDGMVLRTANGGVSWTAQTVDPKITFYGVTLTDARTGIAIGSAGAIYRTTNAGSSWVSQLSGPAAVFRAVSFTDANTGTIVGSSGTILRTTNGGMKWNRQLSGFEETDTLLNALSFLDAMRGIAVGRSGTILRTTDGGLSWKLQTSGTSNHLYAVTFADTSVAYATGDAGIILRSTDGGESWATLTMGVTDFFASLSFSDHRKGTAVGSFGTVFQTTDAGETWTLLTQGPRTSLYGTWFPNAMTGTVVGYRGSVFHTNDGGATWVAQKSGVQENLWDIRFTDPKTAIAIGEKGTILRTTDAGTTWKGYRHAEDEWLSGVSFASPTLGLAVGKVQVPRSEGGGERALILRTTDGGVEWVRQATDEEDSVKQWLFAVSFANSSTAIAVGGGGTILRSTDGGVSWSLLQKQATTVRLNGISSVGSTATIVGDYGAILCTFDFGKTWALAQSGTSQQLNRVWLVNRTVGIAVGNNGTVLRTANGGITWASEPSGTTKDLYAVTFGSVDRGIIVGDRGTILCTTSGDVAVGMEDDNIPRPADFSLDQNYPNPFNPTTTITFRLPSSSIVSLKVYDVLGRAIATLADGEFRPGVYRIPWDASRCSSGIYFYRLQVFAHSGGPAKEVIETKKMVLMK